MPTDAEYEERLSEFDVPHRFVVSGIYELPFGRDRRWASRAPLADAFIGGWSIQAIGQMQTGRPISFHDRNIYFGGDLNSLKTNYSGDTNQPVFDISGFYFNDAAGADQRRRRPGARSARISGFGSRTTSATSRRACRVCAARACTCGTSRSSSSCASTNACAGSSTSSC